MGSVLNPLIALLLRLRKWGGADPDTAQDDGEDRPGSRTARHGARAPAAAHPALDGDDEQGQEKGAPPQKHRLRSFLLYFSMVLAGSMGGVAIAYNLLEGLLGRKSAETATLSATITKHAKTIAAAEKKLAEAQTKMLEAEKKLEASNIAATEKKLEEAMAKRLDVEKKLETTLAESAKTAAEKQKRLDEAVKTLGTIIAAERASKGQKSANRGGTTAGEGGSAGNSSTSNSKSSALKSGDCTLKAGNVAASLKDCVTEHTR